MIDLEQFPNSFPITIQNADHKSIINPDPSDFNKYIAAFKGTLQSNKQISTVTGANKVFFFIHGIRDSKSCFTKTVGEVQKIENTINPSNVIDPILPTYGYLSALRFFIPSLRKKYISWFIDEYAECLARNPNATFSIAGHSNGTYIIGEALKNVPEIKFEHVYLAASVLPPDFKWNNMIGPNKQIQKLRSDMGNFDLPVGVICQFLNNRLYMKDIGSGGADGFQFGVLNLYEEHKFEGGHCAMLNDANVASISNFLVTGQKTNPVLVEHPWYYKMLKKFGDVFILLSLLIILALIYIFVIYVFNGTYKEVIISFLITLLLLVLIFDRI